MTQGGEFCFGSGPCSYEADANILAQWKKRMFSGSQYSQDQESLISAQWSTMIMKRQSRNFTLRAANYSPFADLRTFTVRIPPQDPSLCRRIRQLLKPFFCLPIFFAFPGLSMNLIRGSTCFV
jgi:hypothetical protein